MKIKDEASARIGISVTNTHLGLSIPISIARNANLKQIPLSGIVIPVCLYMSSGPHKGLSLVFFCTDILVTLSMRRGATTMSRSRQLSIVYVVGTNGGVTECGYP